MKQLYQFQTVPLEITERLDQVSLVQATTPWKTFQFTGARGTNQAGEHAFVVNFEWPHPYFVRRAPVHKRETEHIHLNRYITDFTIATGTAPYSAVQEGRDPPDFNCRSEGRHVNLDCTQLTLPSRRTANALFERLRTVILEHPRERFAKLRGCSIYVWFEGSDGKLTLPFRSSDDRAAMDLAEALSEYAPDPSSLLLPSAELPLQAPRLPIGGIQGCRFYAVMMTDAVPATDFFAFTGFELGLAYNSSHSRQSVVHELQRVITKHDQPGIDHLLITAGGPDNGGLSYLSEHVLSAFMLEQRFRLRQTKHLSRVCLHLWHTGAIVQLLPEYRVICGDIYAAGISVASHQSAIPQPAQ
jgi:hypothetical protein